MKVFVFLLVFVTVLLADVWTSQLPSSEDGSDSLIRRRRDQGSSLSVNDDKNTIITFQVEQQQSTSAQEKEETPTVNAVKTTISKPKFTKSIAIDPTWESIDARPLPTWYDESKVGIFIHWGVFSVPAFRSEWFWYNWKAYESEDVVKFMTDNYPPGFNYADFGPQFTAEFYNATQWAELFRKSGAKYIVLTSKHHEGYTLWPSKYAFSWNSQDVGAHRDLLGELATAVRNNTDLRFGLYHSLYEWFNPLWMADKANNLTTDDFVQFKTLPELYELVHAYQPEIVWSDGEWEAGDEYWKSKEFLAWLYNESPVKDTVVTNDRWGGDTLCRHGGYYTCADRYNPGVLQPHKWENCMTLDGRSWGYRRNAQYNDYLTPFQLIKTLIETVSCGGNLLVNVGPTKDGIIVPIQEERLLQMGEWLTINGEAIYSSDPWTHQNDTLTPGVWYTASKDLSKVYVMLTFWPSGGQVQLGAVNLTMISSMQLLGSTGNVNWFPATPSGVTVTLPARDTVASEWAYTIVIQTTTGKTSAHSAATTS